MKKEEIINGDCLEVLKTLENESFDLVLTDPPYGMSYQSAWRTATPKFEKIAGDNDTAWFVPFAKEIYRVLKNDRHAYIFCNDYAISAFRDELEKIGFTNKRTLVWVKNNHTSGDLEGDYGNKTEFILYVQKGRRLLNGKRETNVLEFDRSLNDLHPTQKPTELCAYLVSKSTEEGETVLDPFCGSGSVLEASKALKRGYFGIEIDPTYFKVAQNRLNSIPTPMF